MSFSIHVDRQPELNRFQDILHGRQAERILLIGAPSGRGKTLLLLEYQKIARQAAAPCALVDLCVGGKGSMGVSDALATLGEEWGWEHFPRFRSQVEAAGHPTTRVDVHGVFQLGRPQLQVVLGGESMDARRERRRLLTDALAADLRAWLSEIGRAVVLVDTYNVAEPPLKQGVEPELQEWLEGVFLPHVRRIPGLIVVVAGQQTPPVKLAWEACCCRIELPPLSDPREWLPLAAAIGVQASLEAVSVVCHLCQGEPLAIVTDLNKLRDWGGVL